MAEPIPGEDFQPPGMVGIPQGQGLQNAMNVGVTALQSTAQTINDVLAQRAQIKGKMAGAEDASQIDPKTGDPLPIENLPSPDSLSIYDQAYRDQALHTYASLAISNGGVAAQKILDENPGDPDKVKALWNTHLQETLSKLQPQAIGLVYPDLVNLGNQIFSEATTQNIEYARKANIDAFTDAHATSLATMQKLVHQTIDAGGSPVTGEEGKWMTQLENTASKFKEQFQQYHDAYKNSLDAYFVFHPELKGEEPAMLKADDQLLWKSFIEGVGTKYADKLVKVGDTFKVDTDTGQKFYQSFPDLLGVPAGLFSDKELDQIRSEGMTLFANQANTTEQARINATNEAEAQGAKTFNDIKSRLTTELNDASGVTFDFTKLNSDIANLAANFPTLSSDPKTQESYRKQLIDDMSDQMQKAQNDTFPARELLKTAQGPNVDHANPYVFPDVRAAGPAKQKLQRWYEQNYSQNADGQLHITDDPKIFNASELDDKGGAVWHGGLLDRVSKEMDIWAPGADAQKNANALANYDALMKDRYTAAMVSEDAKRRFEIWRGVQYGAHPGDEFTSMLVGDKSQGLSKDNMIRAASVNQKYLADKGLARKDLSTAINESVGASSSLADLYRGAWQGYPIPEGAKAVPQMARPGVAGTIISATLGNAAAHGIFLGEDNTLRIISSEKADQAFQYGMVDAADMNITPGASARNHAYAYANKEGYNISHTAYDDRLATDIPPDDLQATKSAYVYGYHPAESRLGLPAFVIMRDVAVDQNENAEKYFSNKEFKDLRPAGNISMWRPPGSPSFLTDQYDQGNLKLQWHHTDDKQVDYYNVMLKVMDQTGYHWVQINPEGQFYHYNPAATGDWKLAVEAAQKSAGTANYFGHSMPGRIFGQIASNAQAWWIESMAQTQRYNDAVAKYSHEHHFSGRVLESLTESLPQE